MSKLRTLTARWPLTSFTVVLLLGVGAAFVLVAIWKPFVFVWGGGFVVWVLWDSIRRDRQRRER